VLPLLLSVLAWTPGRGSDGRKAPKKNDVAQKRAWRARRPLSPNHRGPRLWEGRSRGPVQPLPPLRAQSTRPARATSSPAPAAPARASRANRPEADPLVVFAGRPPQHMRTRHDDDRKRATLGIAPRPAQQNSPRQTESFSRTGSRRPVAGHRRRSRRGLAASGWRKSTRAVAYKQALQVDVVPHTLPLVRCLTARRNLPGWVGSPSRSRDRRQRRVSFRLLAGSDVWRRAAAALAGGFPGTKCPSGDSRICSAPPASGANNAESSSIFLLII